MVLHINEPKHYTCVHSDTNILLHEKMGWNNLLPWWCQTSQQMQEKSKPSLHHLWVEWLLAKSRRCGNWLFDQQTMQTNYASKPEWCSAQSHLPRNTGQSARRIDTTLSLFRHFTLWWPERSELVVMTNLSQLWSSGFCWQFTGEQLIQLSVETILGVLICLQCRLQCLSRNLWKYYWPIRCGFHFLLSQVV